METERPSGACRSDSRQNVIIFFGAHRGRSRYRYRDRFFYPVFQSIPMPMPIPTPTLKGRLESGAFGPGRA